MLDDLKIIHERDAQDALGVIEKQFQQLKQTYEVAGEEKLGQQTIENVVLAGMGGSALAADMAGSWPGVNKPFKVVKDYELPSYVGPKTLFIASSYSGNTEETLAALKAAQAAEAQIVVICAGGKLAEIAAEKDYPLYKIPEGFQPRMAVFYNFAALVQLFAICNLISKNSIEELHAAADWLGQQGEQLLPTVVTTKNPAKQIAQELVGNSVVIYAGPKLYSAAYKWKININENAKNVAWCNQFPEFNHNEFLGWTSHPVEKPYKIVELKSSLEYPRTQARFEISNKLLSGQRPHPISVAAEGQSLLEQLLWTIQLGDFVSVYLSLLNGLNPTPVELIEKLKNELKKVD